jgi:hypothetical protein
VDGVSARAKRRWLVRWWIAQGVVLYAGTPLIPLLAGDEDMHPWEAFADTTYAMWMAGFAAFFAALQWVYLRPVRPPVAGAKPVRLVWSMLVGGLAVSLLLGAVLFVIFGVSYDILKVRLRVLEGVSVGWVLLGLLLLNWFSAAPLLLAFAQRSSSHEDHLRRVAAVLFTGTVVEVLSAMPLDMIARRYETCWCGRGTLIAVVLGLFVGTILLGPLVFLLLLARRRRRWPMGRCAACGADVGEGLRIARCPACGIGWAE